MDNPPPVVRFVPDRRVTAAAGVGVVAAVLLAVFATDGPGRLLFGLAAVVLAASAACDLLFSPRLTASAGGVAVLSPLSRVALPWERIEAVRGDVRPRLGRRTSTLEVDAGETLVVLSRRAIGTEPERAAELVNSFRPPAR